MPEWSVFLSLSMFYYQLINFKIFSNINSIYSLATELFLQSSFIGAIAIGDLVKSTMGPKGMDKILVSMGQDGYPGEIQVSIILHSNFKVSFSRIASTADIYVVYLL